MVTPGAVIIYTMMAQRTAMWILNVYITMASKSIPTHYSDVTSAPSASRLFVQRLIQSKKEEVSTYAHPWPLLGELSQGASNAESVSMAWRQNVSWYPWIWRQRENHSIWKGSKRKKAKGHTSSFLFLPQQIYEIYGGDYAYQLTLWHKKGSLMMKRTDI